MDHHLGGIMKPVKQDELRKLPGVDVLLKEQQIQLLLVEYSQALVTYAIRKVLEEARNKILDGGSAPGIAEIMLWIKEETENIGSRSLRPVLNASGIIIHTNLGRAPFGEELLNDSLEVLKGYNNLEFNLVKGSRGQRNDHAQSILQFLTGAEDVVVVNNNAAAVMLILRSFAKGKEAIVSRGELIEIGGSFRIPEIMAASDCKMIEVGATNKTKTSDYEKAIGDQTALLFKTHTSNYVIKGFTQEISLEELSGLGKKHGIPTVYDIGSGLLRKVDEKAMKNEPDVKQALSTGVDMICFSGDKLLGGPQAGIIAGKKKYIAQLKKDPMMRALRVGKATLALLEKACSYYLNDEKLFQHNILFKTLKRDTDEIKEAAEMLQADLKKRNIGSEVHASKGQYGGGTLPDLKLHSFSVKLLLDKKNNFGKKIYHQLLNQKPALLTNLKSGNIYIDLLTLQRTELSLVSDLVEQAYKKLSQ